MGEHQLAVFHMRHPSGEGVRCGAEALAIEGNVVLTSVPGDADWDPYNDQLCPDCTESYDFRVSAKVPWAEYGKTVFFCELDAPNGGWWHDVTVFTGLVAQRCAGQVDTADEFLQLAPGYVWSVQEHTGVISEVNAGDVAHMVMEEVFHDLPANAQEDLDKGAQEALAAMLREWSAKHARNVKTYSLDRTKSVVLGPAFWRETIEGLGLT